MDKDVGVEQSYVKNVFPLLYYTIIKFEMI